MNKILYDGWSLVQAPNSPEALHLVSLLQELHPDVQALVAFPGDPPPWLPEGVQTHLLPTPETSRSRLIWEQRSLPRLVRTLGADLLHLTTSRPPLLGNAACVVSPAEYPAGETPCGFFHRLRDSLGEGGKSRLRGMLWPSDLRAEPRLEGSTQVYKLPLPGEWAISKRGAMEIEELRLPETYILYHGPGDLPSLRRLLDAWSWAAGAVGEHYPLLVLGLDELGRQRLQSLLAGSDLEGSVCPLPVVDPATVLRLYQGSYAVFHPARLTPWGAAGWLALRCGKPLVAAESPLADALAGPAAYLQPEDNPRHLGAAMLTVIVEEQVYQELAQAGQQRAAAWDKRSFRDELYLAYQSILAAG
jgi:glycosyltransferase involved in cell wall biosynthesis